MTKECDSDCKLRTELILHQIKVINERVDKLENLPIETSRLTTVIEMQAESTKEYQKTVKDLNHTLNNINIVQHGMMDNIANLNSSLTKLDQRVEKIENNESNKKIDFGQLTKDVVLKVIPSLVLAYLLLKFGL